MIPRTSRHNFDVQLQVQENKGFPQILYGINQDKDQRSMSLKPGNEYVIELYPYGQVSTDGIMDVPLEKRKCRLDHETFKDSSHPVYTKDNCLYDCRTKKAYETCKCVPWDFANKIREGEECDIFGRTCFFNVMEDLTHKVDESCSHCIDECDWIKYRRKIIEDSEISLTMKYSKSKEACNKYMCVYKKPK